MPLRQNLKPTLPDTLRKLRQESQASNTVPHGIKTVTPGEGLQLLSGDGSEIFWDWETARDYNDRIAAGQAALAEAEAALAQTRLDLDAAGERITDARLEIDGAVTQAAEAKQLVATTAMALETLEGTVGNVQAAVTASDTKMSELSATATAANTAAQDAMSAAEAAEARVQALANAQGSLILNGGFEIATDATAPYRYQTALAQAGSYVGRFTLPEGNKDITWPEIKAAKSQSLELRLWARGVGTYSTTTISAYLVARFGDGTTQSLFATSDSIRPSLSGTFQEYVFRFPALPEGTRAVFARTGVRPDAAATGYVFMDEVTLNDTASYQEALDVALAARTAAENAAADSLAAMTRANQAYDSAQGKNSVRHATTSPQGVGTAAGDTWFQWTAYPGGVVIGQWSWDGTAWRAQQFSHQVMASLDLGKATVGLLKGSYIEAGSVTVDRLTIGVGGNQLADAFFTDAALRVRRAAASTGDWRYGTSGGRVYMELPAAVAPTQTFRYAPLGTSGLIPTVPGRQWRIDVPMYLSSGRARVNIRWYDAFGAAFLYEGAGAYVSGPGDVVATADIVSPAGAVGFLVDIYMPTETTARTAKVFGGASVVVKNASVHIEDGAVTGEKVNAQSVAAAVGRFLTVEAMTGVFTESLTAKDATLLGKTVAQALVVEKLTGRDAILTGTVDVAQLNVTNAMSAEIVKAMDIQARRGIFTEGLTAAEATLLGTTVAENLNADTIGARLVQAGAIVSRDSTGSVQMTPAGLVLQDATPGSTAYTRQVKLTSSGLQGGTRTTQTVNIDGQDNWLMGTFRTALTGSRVSMLSGPTSGILDLWGSANDDHGSVWYDTASSSILNHALTLMGISDYSTNTNNPALRMFPYRGTFAFQGRWARDTDPLKFQVVTNSAGLGPGVYNTFTVSYLSAFPTNNALRFPFVSVESATGADVMATIVSQTQTGVTINVINQSSGKASGALILKVMTLNVGSS